MPRFNDPRHESTEERDLLVPSTALCLRLRRRGQDELVVHRDEAAAEDFVFLFFQHLRKAGGTNFCGLAQKNLLKPQVPQ